MSMLYLVRHGQASFGQPDYDLLSSLGEQQVGLLRDHLHGVAEAPHALYSGTLRRQRDTATILAAPTGTTVTLLDGLNEYSAGSLIRAHAAATGAALHDPSSGERIDPRAFQRRLEEEQEKLLRRQQAFARSRDHTEATEAEFEAYQADANFRISILEQRLERHAALQPKAIADLEARLRADERLMIFYDPRKYQEMKDAQ